MKEKKPVLYEEINYIAAVILMAAGVAFVSRARFGYSMIVAPVYLLFKAQPAGWGLSFGTVEYLFQGALLVLMCVIVRRFRAAYLGSFVTAFVYGKCFDLFLRLVSFLPDDRLYLRILYFAAGTLCISVSVTLFMYTWLQPEVYELLVKEIAGKYGREFGRVKQVYDAVSCVFSIVLSLCLFGAGAFAEGPAAVLRAAGEGYVLEGIGIGTVVAAVVNGILISYFGRRYLCLFETKRFFCKNKTVFLRK